MPDDFFVGYLPAAAARKRFLVVAASLIVLGVFAVGVVLARAQSRFARSYFEFGDVKDYEGIVQERPVPALLSTASDGSERSILLVAPGKHGAGPLIPACTA